MRCFIGIDLGSTTGAWTGGSTTVTGTDAALAGKRVTFTVVGNTLQASTRNPVDGTAQAYGTPLARNFPAVFNYKAQGWRLEGVLRGQCKSVVDGSRLDQYHFGMLRDEWRARKGAKP